jgi:hypothetical protein
MKPSEKIAKQVIETMYAGSEMQFRCDQSRSVPDFDLCLANGTVAVLEVTESVDRIWLETTRAVEAKRHVPAKKCRNSWVVHPRSNTNLKTVRACIDDALTLLEAAGHREFPISSGLDNSEPVERIYREMQRLGIDMAQVVGPRGSGPIIGILQPSRGGHVTTDAFRLAIETEANEKGNKQKLAESNAIERHLFVCLSSRNILPWRVVVGYSPPPDIPPMPDEITHIWAAARTDSGRDVIVWTAERGNPWQNLGTVPISLSGNGL